MLSLTTPLGDELFRPTALSGREAISEPFSFDVKARAANGASVPFEDLLASPVTVTLKIPGGGRRHFNGIVARVSQGRRGRAETAYSLEVVPRLWLLARNVRSRIFQRKTVPEIIAAVVGADGATLALSSAFERREYCVQYNESDLDFVSRLMEEEGIFYFFRHSADGHEMVIANGVEGHPGIPGIDRIRYQASRPAAAKPRIYGWEKSQELRSGRYTLRDHNFQIPGNEDLEVTAAIQPSVDSGEVTHKLALPANAALEVYDYPGEYAQRFDGIDPGGDDQTGELAKVLADGQRTVETRIQEEAAASLVIRGAATARNLVAGDRFTLRNHPDGNGEYVLTSVTHRASVPKQAGNAGSGDYSNTFTCIPAGLPFRPPRVTPRPTIPGPQTATVIGPAGDETFSDRYGRVKVRFHWDRRSAADQDSSCWIRVGALHAGLESGFVAIPEVGDEVLVAFIEGDPDQPIIVGSLYNTRNLPPPPSAGAGG